MVIWALIGNLGMLRLNMNIGMTGSYQDNTKLQAIFENSSATSFILDIPETFIKACWEMLAKLNSTQNKIDVPSYSSPEMCGSSIVR